MNWKRNLLAAFVFWGVAANAQTTVTVNNYGDTLPFDKVITKVDTTGLQVQLGIAKTKITPYGLSFFTDSTLDNHYPLTIYPPNNDPDAVPFLFNMNSKPQAPYHSSNDVMMFGWNIGVGGSNFKPGRPGIGFSMESNFHPGGDFAATWLESHEFYLTPSGQQIRLKSYTVGAPPGTEFIDLYHTVDNFHLRNVNQEDYFQISRNRGTGDLLMNLFSNGQTSLILGRTDYNQSLQIDVMPDRVNFLGQSKHIVLPGTTEWYFDASAIGGLGTGYGLNAGSGINGMGESGNRPVLYNLYTNNASQNMNRAVFSTGSYLGNRTDKQDALTVYNNGAVTIHKQWQQYSSSASLEVGKRSGAKTALKLNDLPVYASNYMALADGLEPGCLYIREGHGLDIVVEPPVTIVR